MSTRPVALVTGANQGIGLQVAKDLFKRGYSVVLGCRDVGKARAAMTEIAKPYEDEIMGEGHKLSCIKLDLGDLSTIPNAVEEYKRYNDRLDVLVNNAGVYAKERHLTLQTNFYGTIEVTKAFLDLLAAPKADKTNNARVVFVSSRMGQHKAAHLSGDALVALTQNPGPDAITEDALLKLAKGWEAGDDSLGLGTDSYSTSKLLISAYARSLAAQLAKDKAPINVLVACPGYTKTNMTHNQGMKSVEDGAETISWVASDAQFDSISGKFFGDHKEMSFE